MTETAQEERHLSLSRTGMDDVHTATAWVVQKLDTEFKDAKLTQFTVQQIMTRAADSDEWAYEWTAAISGHLPPLAGAVLVAGQ